MNFVTSFPKSSSPVSSWICWKAFFRESGVSSPPSAFLCSFISASSAHFVQFSAKIQLDLWLIIAITALWPCLRLVLFPLSMEALRLFLVLMNSLSWCSWAMTLSSSCISAEYCARSFTAFSFIMDVLVWASTLKYTKIIIYIYI